MMRRSGAVFLLACAVVLCPLASVDPARADVIVGLFSDGGTNCSFSGNNPGVVTVHVVVHPDAQGMRVARFAAPIPPCFDATFLNDVVPDGIISIGDSQTGISVATGHCETLPVHVLDINYYSNGSTTPCCGYSLSPDPTVGFLEAIDCSFASVTMTSLTSHFNADSTCDCHQDVPPPDPPNGPSPVDGATFVPVTTALGWTCIDPSFLPVTCDLYLGTDPNPPLVASDIISYIVWSYQPARLVPATTYYWRVVGRNSIGSGISGPTWTFTTRENPLPVVQNLSPSNGGNVTTPSATLKWSGTDDSALIYDVYLGTDPSPPLVTTITSQQYTPGSLPFNATYYWHVVARDLDGGESSTPTWSFTHSSANQPPTVPTNLSPPDGATNTGLSITLEWQCTDPEGKPLEFDVYFGTTEPLPMVRNLLIKTSFSIQGLAPSTLYKWRIVARDESGSKQPARHGHSQPGRIRPPTRRRVRRRPMARPPGP